MSIYPIERGIGVSHVFIDSCMESVSINLLTATKMKITNKINKVSK